MNLERVDKEENCRIVFLQEGLILVNHMEIMEYIVEVLMKFEPSLQLKTHTTPGNQESFATKPKSVPKQPTESRTSRLSSSTSSSHPRRDR